MAVVERSLKQPSLPMDSSLPKQNSLALTDSMHSSKIPALDLFADCKSAHMLLELGCIC